MTAPAQKFRFNDFEFSTRRQELRKSGLRVRLSASQIRLLILFLERPGELVKREEIASRIWSSTATIDVASGVNTAINRLRYSLGDNSVAPRYLETVIGLGYRFIAPLTREQDVAAAVTEADEPEGAHNVSPEALTSISEIAVPVFATKRGLPLWTLWSAFALLLLAALSTVVHSRRKGAVQVPGSAPPLIAVSRITSNSGGRQITAVALSFDGKLLAYADPAGIRVQNLATHQEYSLGTLPASEVNQLSWFPSGDELAVSGRDVNTNLNTVWLISSSGVATSVLATGAGLAAVSPDGNKIAVTRADGAEVWLTDHDRLSLRKLRQAEAKNVFSLVLWSGDSKRLMLVSHSSGLELAGTAARDSTKSLVLASPVAESTQQSEHWNWDCVDIATGKLLAHEENAPMVSAVISPSGFVKFVARTLQGNALAKGRVFSVQTDPATGRFLGAPVNERSFASHSVAALTSSQDGSKLAFIATTRNADVFTALLREDAGGVPGLSEVHRLTANLSDTYPHAWTRDGSVVYETPYQKHLAIFGQQLEKSPVLLAQLPVDAAMAQMTPDAQWFLFLGIAPEGITIYRVPARGGVPERVPGTAGLESEISCARKGPIACVLRRKEMDHGLAERHYFALDPVTGIGSLLARTPWVPARRGDWSLSPDGTTAAVANRDAVHPALNLLNLKGASNDERVIPLSGHSAPLGVGWSADGKALFVETRTADSFALLYMKLDGRPQILRESGSLVWAVPSPDGKLVAFPESTVNANVWVSDSQLPKR